MKMNRKKRNFNNHSTLDCDYNNMKYLQNTVIDDNVISFYLKKITLSLALPSIKIADVLYNYIDTIVVVFLCFSLFPC